MISFPKDFCFLDIIGAFLHGFATNGNEGDLDPRAYSMITCFPLRLQPFNNSNATLAASVSVIISHKSCSLALGTFDSKCYIYVTHIWTFCNYNIKVMGRLSHNVS